MNNPFSKKLTLKSGDRFFGWGESPDADWKVILIATLVLMILVSAWNTFSYLDISKGDTVVSEETNGEGQLLDVEALKDTVNYYQDKALNFEKIKNGEGEAIVDPSI